MRPLQGMEDEALPPQIDRLLRERGMTQADLAAAIRKTPASVSRYCSGRSVPDKATAARIAKRLGVAVDDLGLRQRAPRGPKPVAGQLNWRAIQRAMAKHRINASELADRVGVSRQAVSSFKAGNVMPSRRTLTKMARELGLTLDSLVIPDDSDPR